ncbi:Lin0512 family protein [Sagittula salina]|uniref:Lin0512 family protein n=1 Tax=Sagittula salina TaxID=2820268 RepID=A0A940MN07_9RHOB|nr:Lin0512 family protein [Sagittula salina]MBP0484885.1 Lin0512 family protein [Sagittula salina]
MPRRLLTEFGMGTSLRRQDYTQAACRAVENALWRNSINLAELFGKEKTDMRITVDLGVQQPERVDVAQVAAVFPYGAVTVNAVKGGLDVPRPEGDGLPTVMATVAISVALEGI